MSTVATPDIDALRERERELEQKISDRDSLDERLEVARQFREQAESDLAGQRSDALRKLVAAKIARENAQVAYTEKALGFFPTMRALDEADRLYQRAWHDARGAGCTDLGVKEAPLRVPVDMIPREF